MSDQPVALVTGGSRSIGRSISLALARERFTVLVSYKDNMAEAEKTCREIETAGGKVDSCQADISHAEHRHLLLDYCMEHLGRLDVLVNSAGIAPASQHDLLDVTEDSLRAVLGMNLKAAFFLSQSAARLMIQQFQNKAIPSAAIINVSSILATAATPSRCEECLSRAGLSMATQLFAAGLGDLGINVYEVRTGVIESNVPAETRKRYEQRIKDGLSPIKRWGRPEEVGSAVAMLARGDLSFSTGEVIHVDGGFHIERF